MAFDIMTFLQAFTGTRTFQASGQAATPDSQAEPGAFDAVMAEFTETVQSSGGTPEPVVIDQPVNFVRSASAEPVQSASAAYEPVVHGQPVTFSGRNAFVQSVLDILAGTRTQEEGEAPTTEPLPAADNADDDIVTWPEDTQPDQQEADPIADLKQDMQDTAASLRDFVREKLGNVELSDDEVEMFADHLLTDEAINEIPEDLRGKLGQVINETANALADEEGTEASSVIRVLAELSERLTHPDAESKPADNSPEPQGPVIELTDSPAAASSQEEGEAPTPKLLPAADNADDDIVTWPEDTQPDPQEADPIADLKQDMQDTAASLRDFVREKLGNVELSDDEVEMFADHLLTDEAINEIPEDLRGKLGQVINETANALADEEGTEASSVIRVLHALSEHLTHPDAESKPADDSPEPQEPVIELTADTAASSQSPPSEPETPDVPDGGRGQVRPSNAPSRRVQASSSGNADPEETQETPADTQEPLPNLGEVAVDRNTTPESVPEPAVQNNAPGQAQNPPQSQNQGQPTISTRPQPARTPAVDRATASRPQPERTVSTSAGRTDLLQDFASFAGEMLAARMTQSTSSALPELREELGRVVKELADVLTHEDGAEEHPVVRMLASLLEELTPPETEQEDEAPSDDAVIHAANVEQAGLAGIVIPQSQPVQSQTPEQEQPETDSVAPRQPQTRTVHAQPGRIQTTASRNADTPEDSQEVPDNTQEVRPSFRDVLAGGDTEREDTGQDQNPNPQSQSQEQPRDNTSTPSTTAARSRTDTRRTETSRAQPERSAAATTHRTESRSDFASFFQGVLTARRTASTSSPLPLNLRTSANFTQAAALRDGITNVVRFIRADGVQKARVVVDPPALGRISVELTSGTSGVEASIKVASEQIRQLVQDQLTELRMNLSQQGVQVAEFTVDVFTGQQGDAGQQQNNPQQQERGMFNFIGSADEDETEEFRVDLEEGLLWWVA